MARMLRYASRFARAPRCEYHGFVRELPRGVLFVGKGGCWGAGEVLFCPCATAACAAFESPTVSRNWRLGCPRDCSSCFCSPRYSQSAQFFFSSRHLSLSSARVLEAALCESHPAPCGAAFPAAGWSWLGSRPLRSRRASPPLSHLRALAKIEIPVEPGVGEVGSKCASARLAE